MLLWPSSKNTSESAASTGRRSRPAHPNLSAVRSRTSPPRPANAHACQSRNCHSWKSVPGRAWRHVRGSEAPGNAAALRFPAGDRWDAEVVGRAKGPSQSHADKRLAVMTEDHPLDMSNFEGKNSRGHYGAGTVMVWDRGRSKIEGDVDALKQTREGRNQVQAQR